MNTEEKRKKIIGMDAELIKFSEPPKAAFAAMSAARFHSQISTESIAKILTVLVEGEMAIHVPFRQILPYNLLQSFERSPKMIKLNMCQFSM